MEPIQFAPESNFESCEIATIVFDVRGIADITLVCNLSGALVSVAREGLVHSFYYRII